MTLRDIQIDGIPYDDDQMTKVVAHQIHQAAASDVATAFTDERTTADVFTDLAAVTGVYKYDIDDPIFGGIPRPVFFIEGRQIPRVQSQSALAASKTYSPNAVRVLLDFLLDSVWGPGLDVADIDLASFRRAQLIADRVMQGSASALWDQAYPAALNTLYGTAYSKWSDYFTAVGLTSQSDSGVPGWHGVSAPAVRRYEFHGTLFSTGEWADTVETILEIVPGATLYRSLEGKYKLGLPDPLGSAGTIPQVTDDVLLTPPEVTWPDSDTKLNSVVVRYANVAKDNAADTLEWPPPGSTLATSLLAADGGVALSETVAVEGINNEFAAAAWGASYLLQSRRALYEWTMGRAGFLYEPGDIVRLNSARMGVDVDVVIQRVSSTREWEARIEAQEYHPVDYLWHTEIKDAALATTLPGLAVPVLADVDADLIPGQLRQISVTWNLPANQIPAVIAFDVEWAEFTAAPAATTERSWRSLGMMSAGGEWALVVTISEAARWYEFRVRARGATGIAGAWTTSNVVAIDAGIYGAAWHSADGSPAADLGKIGDYYLNAETGDVYQKTAEDTWTLEGNIKADGDEWHSGSDAPAADLGKIGDWYFRTGTNQIYQKTADDTWTVRATVTAPVWHSGSGAPLSGVGNVGDYGDVYKKTGASTWTLQGNIAGDDGDKWHSGSGAPANSLSTTGDWYFRTDTIQIYEKTGSSTWAVRATVRAPVWHSGSGAPASSLGSVGDYYLRMSNGDVYQKTGASTWTKQGNIAGDDGDKWHSGSGAPANSLGKIGDWYLRTSNYNIYQKTGISTWTYRGNIKGAAASLTTGSVQTTHIAQGAVTHETHFSWSGGSVGSSWANMGSQYVSGGTGYTIVVIAVVTFELDLLNDDSSDSTTISVRIRRGTSTLATVSGALRANSGDSNNLTLIVAADATHGSGATIAVQATSTGGAAPDIISGVASILVFKR